MHNKRLALDPAQTAVKANQLFKSAAFIQFRVVETVYQDIRAIGEAVCPAQVFSRVRSEVDQRVLAFNTVILQIVAPSKSLPPPTRARSPGFPPSREFTDP